MNEQEFQDFVQLVFDTYDQHLSSDDEVSEVQGVRTFQDRQMLTYNKGLVVKLKDGSEFQLEIHQSQQARRK